MSHLGALLFALTIAGYPLVSSLPFLLGVDSRVTSVPYRAAILVISLLIIIYQMKFRSNSRSSTIFYLLWIFWVLYLIRLLSDTLISPIPLPISSEEYLLFAIGVTFIPMVAFYYITNKANLSLALNLSIILLTLAATLCLMQVVKEFLAGNFYYFYVGRLETGTLNAISLGHVGASLGILSLFALLREKSNYYRYIYCGLFFCGVFTLAVAASKGPILSFLFVVMVIIIINSIRKINLSFIFLIIFITAIVCFIVFFVQDKLGLGVISRFSSILEKTDGPVDLRSILIRDAWSQFLDNPIFGSALVELNSVYYPHNLIIESFMATGIFGGIVFSLLMIFTFFIAFKTILLNYEIGWVPLIFLQYWVGVQASGSLSESDILWCYMCAVIVLNTISKSSLRSNRHQKTSKLLDTKLEIS